MYKTSVHHMLLRKVVLYLQLSGRPIKLKKVILIWIYHFKDNDDYVSYCHGDDDKNEIKKDNSDDDNGGYYASQYEDFCLFNWNYYIVDDDINNNIAYCYDDDDDGICHASSSFDQGSTLNTSISYVVG
jgi:hypothetical protein